MSLSRVGPHGVRPTTRPINNERTEDRRMKQQKSRMISEVMLGVLLLIGARLEVAFE